MAKAVPHSKIVQQTNSTFTGFKTIQYPHYTVVTPQSGYTYDMRTMNVSEVIKIRESLLTDNRITENLLKVIWDCIEIGPDHITTYEEFIENTTTNDRDALIYGIQKATFGDTRNVTLE